MNEKINEIDNQLNRLKKAKIGRNWVLNLFKNIEEKIIFAKKEVDIKSFSSLVKELNLNQDDERELIKLRNRITHSTVESKELKAKEKWLKNEIIPVS